MATDRGHYRAIHSVLIDSPEFVSLSPDAKLIFYTVRLCSENNLASIFVFYKESLPRRTRLTTKQVEAAWEELTIGYWIAYADGILWIRNGLRFDPNINLKNIHHRTAVETVVNGLPKSEIVANFIRYYSLSDSLLDRLYHRPSIPYAKQDKEKDKEKEKDKDVSSDLRQAQSSEPLDHHIQTCLETTLHLQSLANGKHIKFWKALEAAYDGYEWLYFEDEIKKADVWCEANPKKRPTPAGLPRFFRSWMERAVERGRKTHG